MTALLLATAGPVATALPSAAFPTAVSAETPQAPIPRPASISLTPVADTTVYDPATPSGQAPQQIVNELDYLDVSGHPPTSSNPAPAQCQVDRSYSLLTFDLTSIPAAAQVTGAKLNLTWFRGYAPDGYAYDTLLALPTAVANTTSASWTEPAAGVRTPDVATGAGDLLTATNNVGDDFIWSDCSDVNQHKIRAFPRNGWALPGEVGQAGGPREGLPSRDHAEKNFVAAVANARAAGATQISFQLYNPTVTTNLFPNGAGYESRYYSSEAADPAVRPKLTLSFATADVAVAVPTGSGAELAVQAAVAGAPTTGYQVEVSGSATCEAGSLGQTFPLGRVSTTTNAAGLGVATGSLALPAGQDAKFVSVSASTPTELSVPSTCLPVGPDNDIWPRALDVGLPLSEPASDSTSTTGYLSREGQARWFRLPVQPGGRVTVQLTNLPADYDLAVFSDIQAAYRDVTNTDDLTRLSAEYAPSVFSPSVFSPSVFSPSVFSPDAYSPSVFSPSVFSPSVFSPSVFSPSVFSPSVFSPSVFSPSVFSPSVFSPSVFSPASFTLNPQLPPNLNAQAFADAQSRTIVAVSATPGTTAETATIDTWNNTGDVYVRVTGRNGVAVPESPFTLSVTRENVAACQGVVPSQNNESAPAEGITTLVLRDSSVPLAGSAQELTTMDTTLQTFIGAPGIKGTTVDLAHNARVTALRTQMNNHPGCVYAANLVAAAIKDVVTAYRGANPHLAYIVLVGPDNVIPFFRYPDQSLLGPESDYKPPVLDNSTSNASLRLNYVLGQDEYGAGDVLDLGGDKLPVPQLAVGRLVETATQVTGMLQAYLDTNGAVTPHKALVTGYDFLTDAAQSVSSDLGDGLGDPSAVDGSLIAPADASPEDPRSWSATDLADTLLPTHHDVVFLAGHFSANSALAADFKTSLLTTQLSQAGSNLRNTLVFSAGCHSGYNIVDQHAVSGLTEPLDWAEAFAAQQATLIAGTGYQYGDTDFLEYSERIYADFAHELRYGQGPVPVGQALVDAKRHYLATTPDPRGLHRKALIQIAVFGLPMFAVNLPANRLDRPSEGTTITGTTGYAVDPGQALGLRYADQAVSATLTPKTVPLTGIGTSNVTATYQLGPDGVVTNPAEPAVPLVSENVSVPGQVLRGVGFRGGAFADSTVVPLTGAATTDLRGVHTPFTSPVFYPMRLATPNYYDALDGGATWLHVTPVQHRAIAGTVNSTMRTYSTVDLRLFYSSATGRVAQASAPSISGVTATMDGTELVFAADAVTDPAAGIPGVWVTYTRDNAWVPLDLIQCVRNGAGALPADCASEQSTHWVGRLADPPASGDLQFMVHAVNGSGLVSSDDNSGSYFTIAPPASQQPPTATTLELTGVPASTAFGSTLTLTATLTHDGNPVPDRPVTVNLGSSGRTALTGSNGQAHIELPVNALPGDAVLRAGWVGDSDFASSAASVPISVDKASTALTFTALERATDGTFTARLLLQARSTDAAGAPRDEPLTNRSVWLTAPTTSGDPSVHALLTDYLGRATLTGLVLPPGESTLTATYLGAAGSMAAATDPTYLESSTQATTVSFDVTVTGPSSVTAGTAYAAQATATPSLPTPTTWALVDAPAWLSIDAATGAISGSVPASPTAFSYRVTGTIGDHSVTSTLVSVTVTAPADLAIRLYGPPVLVSGKDSGYLVAVQNKSTTPSTSPPVVTFTLPADVQYLGVIADSWQCAPAGGQVVCTRASALAGQSWTYLAITVHVNAKKKTDVTMTATLTPADLVPANNVASVTHRVR